MATNLTPGRYLGRLTGHKLGQASTGKLQIAFTFEVAGKINPKDPENLLPEGQGAVRTVIRTVSENNAQWVWQDLDRLGYTGDEFAGLDPELGGGNYQDLTGQEVPLRCEEEFYEGAPRERWNMDFGGGGIQVNPAEASLVKEASKMLGRRAVAAAQGKAPTRTPGRSPAGGGNTAGGVIVPF